MLITSAGGHVGFALAPAQSAAMLFDVVTTLKPGDGRKFFDPDGTTPPLVTQQLDQKPYGMTRALWNDPTLGLFMEPGKRAILATIDKKFV